MYDQNIKTCVHMYNTLKTTTKQYVQYGEKFTNTIVYTSVDGTHERKWGKAKKCLQPTRKTHVAEDSHVIWPWNIAYKIHLAVLSGLICVINVSEILYGRALHRYACLYDIKASLLYKTMF